MRCVLCALAALLVAGVARAADVDIGPGDNLCGAINALGPGDTALLADGTYQLTGRCGISIAGSAQLPIEIRATAGAHPSVHRATADQNIIDFDSASYVTVRGIEFSGGSAGVRLGTVDHFTIEACAIHDTDDVALRANNSGVVYDSLVIRGNELHHTSGTGEGMYLGCNSNGCQVRHSLIEGNYVHHTNGVNVTQGDGIELKEGSADNVIRDNVVHDTGYPCILTYSAVGNGGPNVIERNALWNCGDHAIQSAADAVIRNNLILGSASDGIAMQPHQAGVPSNLVVVHNTILEATGDAISLRSNSGSVIIANNAVYAQSGRAIYVMGGDPGQVVVSGNVGAGPLEGMASGLSAGTLASDLVSASYVGTPPQDLFPKTGGALIGAGAVSYVAGDDFNGTPRTGVADVGAYRYSGAGNSGWAIAAAFKGSTPVVVDAGVPVDSATAADSTTAGDGAVPIDSATAGDSTIADAGALLADRITDGTGATEPAGCRCASASASAGAVPVLALLLSWAWRRRC